MKKADYLNWTFTFLCASTILFFGLKPSPAHVSAQTETITVDSTLITVATHTVAANGFLGWSKDTLIWEYANKPVKLWWEDGHVELKPRDFDHVEPEVDTELDTIPSTPKMLVHGPPNYWEDELHTLLLDWVCENFSATGSYGLEEGIIGKRSGTEVQDMLVGISEGQFEHSIAYNAIKMSIRDTTPASIKVAQFLLETGYCTSTICVLANAGFGVKYQRINVYRKGADVWIFPRTDDDWKAQKRYGWKVIGKEKNDFFTVGSDYIVSYDAMERSYSAYRTFKSATNSMEQHSKLLKKKRYRWMKQRYDRTEYKKWARGLKKSGYATDREYAEKLIDLVERYNLDYLDNFTNSTIDKAVLAMRAKRYYNHEMSD